MTMVDLDAARMALNTQKQCDETGEMCIVSRQALHEVLADYDAIRALPASDACIEAGDAMKAACLKVCEYTPDYIAIEALDTAAIVGDGA
jgi:hypothetical protein